MDRLPTSVACGVTTSVTPETSRNEPVRNRPAGNTTRPPPPVAQASIARWMAGVSSATPSPSAPQFLTFTSSAVAQAGDSSRAASSARVCFMGGLMLVILQFLGSSLTTRTPASGVAAGTVTVTVPPVTGIGSRAISESWNMEALSCTRRNSSR